MADHALPKQVDCRAALLRRYMKGIGDLSDRGCHEKETSNARTPLPQSYWAAVPQAAKAFHLCPKPPDFSVAGPGFLSTVVFALSLQEIVAPRKQNADQSFSAALGRKRWSAERELAPSPVVLLVPENFPGSVPVPFPW